MIDVKLIKEYVSDLMVPSTGEILECLYIAESENCIVRLNWFFPCSGWYKLDIKKDMTLEYCLDKLPKNYGV